MWFIRENDGAKPLNHSRCPIKLQRISKGKRLTFYHEFKWTTVKEGDDKEPTIKHGICRLCGFDLGERRFCVRCGIALKNREAGPICKGCKNGSLYAPDFDGFRELYIRVCVQAVMDRAMELRRGFKNGRPPWAGTALWSIKNAEKCSPAKFLKEIFGLGEEELDERIERHYNQGRKYHFKYG